MDFKNYFIAVVSPIFIILILISYLPIKAILVLTGIAFISCVPIFFMIKSQFKFTFISAVMLSLLVVLLYVIKYQSEVLPISNIADKTAVVDATIVDIINEAGIKNSYRALVTSPFEDTPKEFLVNLYSSTPLDVDYYDKIHLSR